MKTIMRIKFGSHLYNTANEKSDMDFKSVFIPDARDILLQRATKVISDQRSKSIGEKNVAGEIDEEKLNLQKFLKLISEGQTGALDMFFAPPDAHVIEPSPIWKEIVANKDCLITKKSSAFVGYCRQQANKYGIKGERVKAAKAAYEALCLMNEISDNSKVKLAQYSENIESLIPFYPDYMSINRIHFDNGGFVDHWEVCGRKMPYTGSIGSAAAIMKKLIDEYGHRALAAENQQGVDWKAMSHAVRIAEEAIELLSTGKITLPLPNASYIREIKEGRHDYDKISEYIDKLIIDIESLTLTSNLQDEPDYEWIDNFVCRVYKDEVVNFG
jgi:hypothetical protein